MKKPISVNLLNNNWIPKNDKENVNFKKPFNKRPVYIVL